MAQEAFFRVQRLSTEWHANTLRVGGAPHHPRQVGMDLLNDTVLIALLPSAVALVKMTVVLGPRWPVMDAVVLAGSTAYVALSVARSRCGGWRRRRGWRTATIRGSAPPSPTRSAATSW
jgi:ATP-binding cassette, subfamily B, bacterial